MRKRKEKVDVKRRLFLVWCYLKGYTRITNLEESCNIKILMIGNE